MKVRLVTHVSVSRDSEYYYKRTMGYQTLVEW